MKIAVIFSGFFRTFSLVKKSLFDNVIKDLNPDIYFSSPKTMFALPEDEVREFHHINSADFELVDPSVFGENLITCELRTYNSNYYKRIIKENNFPEKNEFNQYFWRILSQMDSISLSVNLFKKHVEKYNIKYDIVILTRPDIKYYSNIDLSKIDSNLIQFPLHSIVNGNKNTVECGPSYSLNIPFNDQIIIGSQDNILSYSNLYEKIIDYVKEGICFNPETLQGIHTQKLGIDFKPIDFVLYELYRK